MESTEFDQLKAVPLQNIIYLVPDLACIHVFWMPLTELDMFVPYDGNLRKTCDFVGIVVFHLANVQGV